MSEHTNYLLTQNLNLSRYSAEVFRELRNELGRNPQFMHRVSASVMLEFLIWHYRRTADQTRFADFSPRTPAQGRPRAPFPRDQRPSQGAVRPAEVRKHAGLDQHGNPTKL